MGILYRFDPLGGQRGTSDHQKGRQIPAVKINYAEYGILAFRSGLPLFIVHIFIFITKYPKPLLLFDIIASLQITVHPQLTSFSSNETM